MMTEGRNGGSLPGDADRDPRLDRLYRETAQEEPPARLDSAILAAAHREVGARPRPASARLRAWRVPLSVAAVVVLSVSLVTLVREEGGGELDRPAAGDGISPPRVPASAEKARAHEAPGVPAPAAKHGQELSVTAPAGPEEKAEARRAAGASADRSTAPEPLALPRPAAPAPRPFPAAPAAREQRPDLAADQAAGVGAASQSIGVRGSQADSAAPAEPTAAPAGSGPRLMQRDRAAAGGAAESVGGERPAAGVSPAAKPQSRAEPAAAPARKAASAATARAGALVKELELQPAEKWLEKVAALRREGRTEEAEELLAEFRRRFPGYSLPPELR